MTEIKTDDKEIFGRLCPKCKKRSDKHAVSCMYGCVSPLGLDEPPTLSWIANCVSVCADMDDPLAKIRSLQRSDKENVRLRKRLSDLEDGPSDDFF